jgi:hypothetical protein
MEASTGSIFCCEVEVLVVDMLIRWRPTTAAAGAVREKRVAVPVVVVIKCDECDAKTRAGVKAATDDEKGEDVKASRDAAKREPSKALL